MKIALCQMQIVWEDKENNRQAVHRYFIEAEEKKVDLLLFPEMTLTGFSMNIEVTAEEDSETLTFFKQEAVLRNVSVGFGWVKRVGKCAENHYTIMGINGKIINDYVKIHPFSYSGEDIMFNAGEKVQNFKIDNIEFGNFICYDLRFPEVFQISSKEAHVIIVPANWPAARAEHWKCLLQARAIENQVYILGINCVGYQKEQYYLGDSCVINPNGEISSMLLEHAGLLIYDLKDDVEHYRRLFPMRKDRKESFYQSNY